MTPIRLEMLTGSALVFDDPAPLVRLFAGEGIDGYEVWARGSPRYRLVTDEFTAIKIFFF
jgi:hypothetical protein